MPLPYTLREFAQTDRLFRVACDLAHIAPTRRQASKWHRHEGLAFEKIGEAKAFCAKHPDLSEEVNV